MRHGGCLRYHIFIIVVLCMLALCVSASAEADGMVRVKLSRLGKPTSVSFMADCAYYVNNNTDDKIPGGTSVTVSLSGGNLTLRGGGESMSLGKSFTVNRKSGGTKGVKFSSPSMSNVFTGDITFSASSGGITVIMTTYVEDYLYGVVGYEMSNSYPIEALKAQSVAARNYVLRKKLARSSAAFDVTDTTSDQVYKGYNPSYKRVKNAVDGTKGCVLAYKGELAYCYYGASNGGQTESTKNAWGSGVAYSTVKDDKYDLESGATSRSVTLFKDQTGRKMNANLKNVLISGIEDVLEKHDLSTDQDDITIDKIVSITPVKPKYPAPSMLYRELEFVIRVTARDRDGQPVSGKVKTTVPTYGAFEKWFDLSINSSANETIWVEDSDDSIKITFRRWGHGIGMSQRGARVMAENYSMDFGQILDFYYPGTKLKTINLTDTTGSGLKDNADDDWGEPKAKAYVCLSDEKSGANMRAQAQAGSDVIKRVSHGAQVDLYGISGDWVACGYDGAQGYIKRKFLSSDKPTSNEPVYAKVKLTDVSSKLKVRKKASADSAVVCLVGHGSTVKALAINGDWIRIETASGKTGYVKKQYLRKAKPAESAAEFSDDKITDVLASAYAIRDTSVYISNDADSAVIAKLRKGDSADILAIGGKWAYVTFGDNVGFVAASDLGRIEK